ncbi:MAG: DUF3179 domain-containing protein [Porticoccus sp.]
MNRIEQGYAVWQSSHPVVVVTLLLVLFCPLVASSPVERNGFVISEPLIPINEIYGGGPPRDGIPSLDDPAFISASDAGFLSPDDKLLGMSVNGVKKAFPIGILDYHELVNDAFNGQPVTLSYCPLCGTGIAFNPMVDGKHLQFGVSGLLYNNDLLMYDRNTDSLWSQMEGRAISGPLKGVYLERLPVEHTTWRIWRERHPDTLVLSGETGFYRNYGASPYPAYDKSRRVLFPLSNYDKRYHPKEMVIGIELGDKTKAYPFTELASGKSPLTDTINGQALSVEYSAQDRSARILDDKGEVLTSVTAYWFAWMAFHPDSDVYTFEE